MAAVAGATYVLRHAVTAVLVGAADGECVGVRTVAGQTLRCSALAADVASLQEMLRQRGDDRDEGTRDAEQAPGVARAVCIMDASLQVDHIKHLRPSSCSQRLVLQRHHAMLLSKIDDC